MAVNYAGGGNGYSLPVHLTNIVFQNGYYFSDCGMLIINQSATDITLQVVSSSRVLKGEGALVSLLIPAGEASRGWIGAVKATDTAVAAAAAETLLAWHSSPRTKNGQLDENDERPAWLGGTPARRT